MWGEKPTVFSCGSVNALAWLAIRLWSWFREEVWLYTPWGQRQMIRSIPRIKGPGHRVVLEAALTRPKWSRKLERAPLLKAHVEKLLEGDDGKLIVKEEA